jgi:hypothetical protein
VCVRIHAPNRCRQQRPCDIALARNDPPPDGAMPGPQSMPAEVVQFECPSCGNAMEIDRPVGEEGAATVDSECCFCGIAVEVSGCSGASEPRAKMHRIAQPPSAATSASNRPAPTPERRGTIAPDEPFFLPIPEDVPTQLNGVITDGLALRCSGDRSSGLYGSADDVLRTVLGDDPIDQYDDPSWTRFPQIAQALQHIEPAWEECFCVFVCRPRGVWGLGIANEQRNRRDAGKIALAGAAVAKLIVEDAPPPRELDRHPAFVAFLRAVRRFVD